MIELLQAINTAFNADGSEIKTLFAGGLSFDVAPSVAENVLMQVIGSPLTNTYGGEAFSELQLQFTVWAEGDSESLVKARKFCTWLRTVELDTAAAQVFALTRQHEPLPAPDSPQQNANGVRLYGWIVTYVASVTPTEEPLT